MRLVLIAALLASQTVPAAAASLETERRTVGQETGSFAGARLRLNLGGNPSQRLRAGFVVAPTTRAERSDGSVSLRFGEGFEYGITGNRAPGLSIAGQPIGQTPNVPGEGRAGVSTIGWVAIGVGALVVLVVAAGVICVESNCLGSK